MNKLIRLTKALAVESRHRLPYIFIVIGILFLFQFIKLNFKTAESVEIAKNNTANSKTLLKKVAELSADNKKLGEQNNKLARENAAHIDCIAELFARYTRDGMSITIVDLNSCQALAGLTPATSPAPTNNTRSNNNTNLPTTNNKNPTPNSQPTPKQASEPLRVLGLPVCLPLSNVCARQ